jgi:hypothetical protein
MSTTVGTLAWAKAGGNLRPQDRVRLIAQAVYVQMANLPSRVRDALGLGDTDANLIDLSAIRFPDSAASRRASELAASVTEPWLFNHCLRTYIWGTMLAQAHRIKFDEELFFVASALHDLGLADNPSCKVAGCTCFAVEGARAADKFALDIGWDNERRDRLSNAISLHLNVRVGLKHGPEAHLLHEGAALDVIGARVRELPVVAVESVLTQYPRMNLKRALSEAMKAQSRESPQSRAAFLVGLGFVGMIRSAPLDDPAAP